jgi:hypothetical protein
MTATTTAKRKVSATARLTKGQRKSKTKRSSKASGVVVKQSAKQVVRTVGGGATGPRLVVIPVAGGAGGGGSSSSSSSGGGGGQRWDTGTSMLGGVGGGGRIPTGGGPAGPTTGGGPDPQLGLLTKRMDELYDDQLRHAEDFRTRLDGIYDKIGENEDYMEQQFEQVRAGQAGTAKKVEGLEGRLADSHNDLSQGMRTIEARQRDLFVDAIPRHA